MSTPVNTVIYVGNFSSPYPSSQQQQQYAASAADLSGSGFTTMILWNLHIDAYGNFRYTNSQYPLIADGKLQQGYEYLPELLASILGSGTINKVMFSLGGWQSEGDYVHCAQLINQYGTGPDNPIVRNFVALQEIGVSGIDFDLEAGAGLFTSHAYPYYLPVVVQLTNMLANLHLTVTYCPYTSPQFWVDCLSTVYAQQQIDNVQPVSWMNLQCYSGGVANTHQDWVGYLENNASLGPLGISNPAAFIVPGFGVPGICPQGAGGLQAKFSDPSLMAPGIAGGFVFTYGGIQTNQQNGTCAPTNATADYASAIVQGIQALPTS